MDKSERRRDWIVMSTPRRREGDDEASHEHERRQSNWRLQREISIPTLVMLCANLGALIWWAATTGAKVDSLEKTILQNNVAQHTVDARQDAEIIRAESRIIAQLERFNAKLDRIIENSHK